MKKILVIVIAVLIGTLLLIPKENTRINHVVVVR